MSDRKLRIVLTGAGRGLGLELARQWLDAGHEVFALSRETTPALAELRERAGERLDVHPCDVANDPSVKEACQAISRRWRGLDLLVNNAGVYGPRGAGLRQLDMEEIAYTFSVNAQGPLRVAKGLLPLLRKGEDAKIVSITSRMGSIADNTSGGSYAYRMSKAALNMATMSLAHELREKGIAVAVLHPGWVRTDMGGDTAPLSVEESVRGMIAVIDRLTVERSGAFLDFAGEEIPW